jgi:micrococcal nuclease
MHDHEPNKTARVLDGDRPRPPKRPQLVLLGLACATLAAVVWWHFDSQQIARRLGATYSTARSSVRQGLGTHGTVPVVTSGTDNGLGTSPTNNLPNEDPALDIPAPPSPALYAVVRVLDGDTIDVKSSTGAISRVRFIGVDTPETKDPRKPVQCFGKAASDHTKKTLLGATIRLEADPLDSNKDKYDRLLRYVYTADGQLYNQTLIEDGYGFAYVVFPYARLEQFRAAERDARLAGRGLWAGCGVDQSQAIKQTTSR